MGWAGLFSGPPLGKGRPVPKRLVAALIVTAMLLALFGIVLSVIG
jgi:hypothetical protein